MASIQSPSPMPSFMAFKLNIDTQSYDEIYEHRIIVFEANIRKGYHNAHSLAWHISHHFLHCRETDNAVLIVPKEDIYNNIIGPMGAGSWLLPTNEEWMINWTRKLTSARSPLPPSKDDTIPYKIGVTTLKYIDKVLHFARNNQKVYQVMIYEDYGGEEQTKQIINKINEANINHMDSILIFRMASSDQPPLVIHDEYENEENNDNSCTLWIEIGEIELNPKLCQNDKC